MREISTAVLICFLFGCAENASRRSIGPGSGPASNSDAGTFVDATPSSDAGITAMDASLMDSGQSFPSEVYLGPDARPAIMHIPADYVGATALPLVILLHGYSVSADVQESYFRLSTRVDEREFFLLRPQGTSNPEGKPFWNATNACCNFYGSTVDDVGYLKDLIEEAKADYSVDEERIYFIGHSNGGFMSYRMACEHADLITAIVSLAGSTHLRIDDCGASEGVSVLQIHGDQDTTIPFNGYSMGSTGYPSAPDTVERWAERAGCNVTLPTEAPAIDFDVGIAGNETDVTEYTTQCTQDLDASLWRIRGGTHIPALSADFPDLVLDWMLRHRKR